MRILLCVALALTMASAALGSDWPEPRQNAHLTAFQPAPGAMSSAPVVLAELELGRAAPAIRPVALPDGSDHVGLAIAAGALYCFDTSGELRWMTHPPGLNLLNIVASEDLNGDGSIEILLRAGRPADPYGAAVLVSLEDGALLWRYDVEPMSYAWYLYAGNYLTGETGKQIVVIMHGYPPDAENGYIAFFDFTAGGEAPAQRWRYDFHDYTCFPSFLQTDLDGDGTRELVVQTHSRMWFLSPHTGELKHYTGWDVSPANVRSYGLVEFVDLDGDGREDFLCIANFAQHHEVLLNRDGVMVKAWHYGWPESVTTGKVATTWPEPPYADVDGDGKLELVVSMFNSEEDEAWLVRVYDAVTGEPKYRIPGVLAAALEDVTGDGVAEILVNASDDPTAGQRDAQHVATACSGARAYQFRGGGFELAWVSGAAFALRRAPGNRPHIELDGALYTLAPGPSEGLTPQPWQAPAHTPGPDFSAVPALAAAGPLPELLAADLTGDGRNELIAYHAGNAEVFALAGGALSKIGAYPSSALPVMADFTGDGRPEIALCTVGPEQQPVLRVVSPSRNGAEVWQSVLPPPGRHGLPAPRVAYLRAGHFTGKPTSDIYAWIGAPVVRSVVLDGQTGEVVWERSEFEDIERYYGPSVNLAAAHDFNSDGADDLVFTNPDWYCVADGPTGEMLLGPLFPPDIFDQPSQGLYTLPAILERQDAPPLVAMVAGHYFQGVMTLDAAPIWYRLPAAGENRCAQEGFLRAEDGAWLMGFGRQNGRFACVNAADGSLRWELDVQASASDVAAADVNGDGNAEFVFGTSHGQLYAVADVGGAPEIRWAFEAGAGLGAPILADFTGSGRVELAVTAVDGRLLVLGPADAGQAAGL